MRIQRIQIKNFGSLRDLPLDNLGYFTVLLGKNGAGKSFLFEALHCFFSEFNAIGGATTVGVDDNLWYGRIADEPIQLNLTFQLNETEIGKNFAFPKKTLNDIKNSCNEEAFHQVEISRSLTFKGNWKTNFIKWADIEIIKDDQMVGTEKLAELQKMPETLDAYQFAFFTPKHSVDNIGGDRLLIDLANKTAYYSDAQIDSLVSRNVIKAAKVYSIPEFQKVADWRTWAAKEGYTIVEHPPTAEEAPKIHEAIVASSEPSSLQQAISNLTQLIKGTFKLIPAARDAQASPGVHRPFAERATLDSWKVLSLSRNRKDEIKWGKYRSEVEPVIGKDLEPNPDQLLVRDGDLRLPPAYMGGGEQAIMEFKWWLLDDKAIFAIEEPENHLHPGLCRQIFRFLKQQSRNRQVFLSTHSPMFADKKDINNNWAMRYERHEEGEHGESKIQRIESRDDLKLALAQLGVLPSDIYLKDFVVFVEGGTEKEAVLPILGSKLRLNMEDNIGVLAIGGESKLEHYLKIWLEIMQYAPADYLVILDKHSGELASRLVEEMNIESSRFHVWQKGSIEDYYPPNIAIEALKELFGVEVTSKDIDKKEPLDKELKRILESQGKICKGWKIEIGTYVANKIETEKIPKEIKGVFKSIQSRVEL